MGLPCHRSYSLWAENTCGVEVGLPITRAYSLCASILEGNLPGVTSLGWDALEGRLLTRLTPSGAKNNWNLHGLKKSSAEEHHCGHQQGSAGAGGLSKM